MSHHHGSSNIPHFGGVLGPIQELKSNRSENELDVDTCLKVNNYEDTVRQLDMYYGLGTAIFIIHYFPSVNN